MVARETYVELGSDYRQFLLDGIRPAAAEDPVLPANTLAEWRSDPEPDFETFSVSTGSQFGPFGVTVRALDVDPGSADPGWEDVVEISVHVEEQVAVSDVVNGPMGGIEGVSGPHRMRIAARGRTESAARDRSLDEEDDAVALEQYLIELWPAAPMTPLVVREVSQFACDLTNPPEPKVSPEAAAGTKAAWAIIRDVRQEPGARPLPGELGIAIVEREFPLTTTKLFNRVHRAFAWPPCRGGIFSKDDHATQYYDITLPDESESESEYAQLGCIATTLVELDKPRRVVKRWNWVQQVPGSVDRWPPLLAADSTVTITVEKTHTRGEDPRARVSLTHDGIPTAWIEDLETMWAWELALDAED